MLRIGERHHTLIITDKRMRTGSEKTSIATLIFQAVNKVIRLYLETWLMLVNKFRYQRIIINK